MAKIHILGIGGTFMTALAILAKELGHQVTGNDAQCYPPMSDLLQAKDIEWIEGYEDATHALKADLVIVGNAISRGVPVLEAIMSASKPYISGPQWLAEHVLPGKQVVAVSGTHGKTTTTSMIAWILDQAGYHPGFLIGGVATDFATSARLGSGGYFVIEADEYDTAFYDKRPKFMHYRPNIAVLNNLEFDHADIYPDLEAIKLQFHYLIRTVPKQGLIIYQKENSALREVLAKGCYSDLQDFSSTQPSVWHAKLNDDAGKSFEVLQSNQKVASINWPLIGQFNIENALAATAACARLGVDPMVAAEALQRFSPVKRRLEVKLNHEGITVYDDFAHHPTAIGKTLEALKKSNRHKRIFAVLEFASYTMRTGIHAQSMQHALKEADCVFVLEPKDFNLDDIVSGWGFSHKRCADTNQIVSEIVPQLISGDAVLVMSNRGFNGIHNQLMQAIQNNQVLRK